MLRIASKEGIMLREKYMEGRRSTWWRKVLNLLPTDGKEYKVQDVIRRREVALTSQARCLGVRSSTFLSSVSLVRRNEHSPHITLPPLSN
jgi:hypothetical protein